MKKLIVAMAAIVFGVSAQAAALNWGGFVSNGLDANQTAQEGTVFNLVYLGSTDLSSSLGNLYFDTRTGLVGTGEGASWTAAAGQTLVDTHSLNATEAGNWAFQKTFERADADGGVNGNYLVIMYDATTPNGYWAGQYTVSGVSDVTSAGSIEDTSWTIGATMTEKVTTSVPEPTSGLLMLVGLAGLALRRRRA